MTDNKIVVQILLKERYEQIECEYVKMWQWFQIFQERSKKKEFKKLKIWLEKISDTT